MTTYKYREIEFEIDDSKGCYIEVAYKGLTAYAGIYLKGTPGARYAWWVQASGVTKDGLTVGNSAGDTTELNLNAACDWIIGEIEKREREQAFDQKAREQACAEIHDFVKKLP